MQRLSGPSELAYSCPHCHNWLEAATATWQGWILCPECHRPGLPPPRAIQRLRRRVEQKDPHLPYDRPSPSAGDPRREALTSRGPSLSPGRLSQSSTSRLIVLTGLVISLFLLLVAYLDRSSQSSAIFGFLTIVFFLLMLRLPRGQ